MKQHAGITDLVFVTTQDRYPALKRGASPTKLIVMTIGHSTRPIKEFIQLLKAHEVKRLVDVRTVPRSRHNPQFNRSQLSSSCIPPAFITGTCPDWVASGMPALIP